MKLDKYLNEATSGWSDIDDIQEEILDEIKQTDNKIVKMANQELGRMLHTLQSKLSKYDKKDISKAIDQISRDMADLLPTSGDYVSDDTYMEFIQGLER